MLVYVIRITVEAQILGCEVKGEESSMLKSVIAESSVTQKYQATIPLKVREQLGIRAGDKIIFEQQADETIAIKKKCPSTVDWDYLHAIEATLSEWNSPEDDAAYENL